MDLKMAIPKFSLPNVSLPNLFAPRVGAGLVIRPHAIELLAGPATATRIRVPVEGKRDEDLTLALQQAVGSAALKSRRMAVALAIPDVLVRFFTIPVLPKTEWEAAVQFEARKYIPFKTDTMVWDFRVLTASPAETTAAGQVEKLDVVFTAIQRDVFRRIIDALSASGIQPAALEPQCLGLARLVGSSAALAPEEFACIVDVESDAAHLAIVRNRMPYLTRDINLTPNGTVPSVAAPAGAEPAATPPVEVQDPRALRLLSEISVSMDFFRREYPTTTVSRVWLVGEETLVGPWCRWLSEQLRCTVELGSALMEDRGDGDTPLSFASAVGLLDTMRDRGGAALDFLRRGLGKTPMPSTAVPASLVPAQSIVDVLKDPQTLISAGIVAAAVIALFWGVGAQRVTLVQRQLDELTTSRKDVGFGLSGMAKTDLAVVRKQAEGQLKLLAQVTEQRVSVAQKLDAMARALPDGVWLTKLALEDRLDPSGKSPSRLNITGACYLGGEGEKELGAIQQFEDQLKRNPKFIAGFSTAQLDQINAQAANTIEATYRTFQLNCNSGPRKSDPKNQGKS